MPRIPKKPQIYVKFTIGMKNPPQGVNVLSEGFTMGCDKEITLSEMIYSFAVEVISTHIRLAPNDIALDEINSQIKKAASSISNLYVILNAAKEVSPDGQTI
jgi:hypothetical protein